MLILNIYFCIEDLPCCSRPALPVSRFAIPLCTSWWPTSTIKWLSHFLISTFDVFCLCFQSIFKSFRFPILAHCDHSAFESTGRRNFPQQRRTDGATNPPPGLGTPPKFGSSPRQGFGPPRDFSAPKFGSSPRQTFGTGQRGTQRWILYDV